MIGEHQGSESTVEACPECDSSKLTRRKRSDLSERYRCKDCDHTFAEPDLRPPKQPGGNISPAGQALIEADPEDVDLITDGGVGAEAPTPNDYDGEDSFDDDRGLEQCPHCEQGFSANGLYMGPVWDKAGRRFDLYLDAPAGAVLFCEECWPVLDRNRKQSENASLVEFA